MGDLKILSVLMLTLFPAPPATMATELLECGPSEWRCAMGVKQTLGLKT